MIVPIEVESILREIDHSFLDAKEKRLSRMDVSWGAWSRQLNIRIREMQKDALAKENSNLNHLLVWCFMYWVNRSQLLELHHKHRLTKHRQKRILVVEGEKIKRIILSGDPVGPPGQDEQIRALLKDVQDRQA